MPFLSFFPVQGRDAHNPISRSRSSQVPELHDSVRFLMQNRAASRDDRKNEIGLRR